MVAKSDWTDVGMMAGGAVVGAVAANYGSDWISGFMTKTVRDDPKKTPADVTIIQKAYTYDVLLGALAAVGGMYTPNKSAALLLKSAGVYLVANGLIDGVGDFMQKNALLKTWNGRPQGELTNTALAKQTVPLSHGCGGYRYPSANAMAMNQNAFAHLTSIPSSDIRKVNIY